jgi:hypothetical protein
MTGAVAVHLHIPKVMILNSHLVSQALSLHTFCPQKHARLYLRKVRALRAPLELLSMRNNHSILKVAHYDPWGQNLYMNVSYAAKTEHEDIQCWTTHRQKCAHCCDNEPGNSVSCQCSPRCLIDHLTQYLDMLRQVARSSLFLLLRAIHLFNARKFFAF